MGNAKLPTITAGAPRKALITVIFCAAIGAIAWTVASGRVAKTASRTETVTESAAPVPAPALIARPELTSSGPPMENAEPPAPAELGKSQQRTPVQTAALPLVVERTALGPLPAESGPAPPAPPAPVTGAPEPTVAPTTPPPLQDAPRAAPLMTPRAVNVNTAPKAELELLPGIGPALADRIIEARTRQRFTGPEDLDKVRGIGPKMLEKLKGRIVYDDPAPSPGR